MSVPKSKRGTAPTEYVHTAHTLCSALSRWVNHLPKRYAFRELNPLCAHADMVAFHVEAANHVYVRDPATFEQRRAHLLEAEAYLIHVESKLATIYEVQAADYREQMRDAERRANAGECVRWPKEPNTNNYARFADLIEKERMLIAGVKRRDTQRYNNVGQDAADAARVQPPVVAPSIPAAISGTATRMATATTTTPATRTGSAPDSTEGMGDADGVTQESLW